MCCPACDKPVEYMELSLGCYKRTWKQGQMPTDTVTTKEEFAIHKRLKGVESDVQYLTKMLLNAQKRIFDIQSSINKYRQEEMGTMSVLVTFALCVMVGFCWSELRNAA